MAHHSSSSYNYLNVSTQSLSCLHDGFSKQIPTGLLCHSKGLPLDFLIVVCPAVAWHVIEGGTLWQKEKRQSVPSHLYGWKLFFPIPSHTGPGRIPLFHHLRNVCIIHSREASLLFQVLFHRCELLWITVQLEFTVFIFR